MIACLPTACYPDSRVIKSPRLVSKSIFYVLLNCCRAIYHERIKEEIGRSRSGEEREEWCLLSWKHFPLYCWPALTDVAYHIVGQTYRIHQQWYMWPGVWWTSHVQFCYHCTATCTSQSINYLSPVLQDTCSNLDTMLLMKRNVGYLQTAKSAMGLFCILMVDSK